MNAKKILCSLAVSASVVFAGMTVQAHVLDGAQQFKGHYYKNFETQMPWEDAQAFCKSMGGYATDRGIWKWLTGGVITDQNWRRGEPNCSLQYKPKMYIIRGENGEWCDYNASEKYAFVCEWETYEQAHDSDW